MTKRLDETFDISSTEYEDDHAEEEKTVTELLAESDEILNSITHIEKIDNALSSVSGLNEHDKDMDDVSTKAIKSYTDLCDLGMNVPDANAARIFEVAATMLKTAMDAKDAKVNRKLKTIELQLKKAKLDWEMAGSKDMGNSDNDGGAEFDRNELLARVIDSRKANSDESNDKHIPK